MAYKQFEITGKCNLRCEACYNQKLMGNIKEIESESVLERVSVGDVVYIGGGEPMIHPEISKIVHGIIDKPAEVVVSTDGIIYRKMPEQAQIQVSVWTLNPELYKGLLRGTEEQLDEVLRNIPKYISDKNPVLINMPVYERNFPEIDSVSNYADSLEVPLRINPISPANGFSVNSNLENKIEDFVFDLKLIGRNIIYSKNKQPVKRFYREKC